MALSNDPQNIDKHNWYYEERHGISLVHEIYVNGKHIGTDLILIPWRKIRASLKRKDTKA